MKLWMLKFEFCIIFTSQNVIVPQSLKNVENIFCLCALQKQAVGWISLRGHSLLVPAWYKI